MKLNVSQLADGVFIGWLVGPSSGRSVIISNKGGKLRFQAPIGAIVMIIILLLKKRILRFCISAKH